jgi:plasmid maintenance system antidote protein VapI
MTTIELILDDATVSAIAAKVAHVLGMPADAWLNVRQAAGIHDLVARGKLQVTRDGRRLLFRRAWLDEVLA